MTCLKKFYTLKLTLFKSEKHWNNTLELRIRNIHKQSGKLMFKLISIWSCLYINLRHTIWLPTKTKIPTYPYMKDKSLKLSTIILLKQKKIKLSNRFKKANYKVRWTFMKSAFIILNIYFCTFHVSFHEN